MLLVVSTLFCHAMSTHDEARSVLNLWSLPPRPHLPRAFTDVAVLGVPLCAQDRPVLSDDSPRGLSTAIRALHESPDGPDVIGHIRAANQRLSWQAPARATPDGYRAVLDGATDAPLSATAPRRYPIGEKRGASQRRREHDSLPDVSKFSSTESGNPKAESSK